MISCKTTIFTNAWQYVNFETANKSKYQNLAILSSEKYLFSCWNLQNTVQEIVGFKKVGINTLYLNQPIFFIYRMWYRIRRSFQIHSSRWWVTNEEWHGWRSLREDRSSNSQFGWQAKGILQAPHVSFIRLVPRFL